MIWDDMGCELALFFHMFFRTFTENPVPATIWNMVNENKSTPAGATNGASHFEPQPCHSINKRAHTHIYNTNLYIYIHIYINAKTC
jgi:hypothetical protein